MPLLMWLHNLVILYLHPPWYLVQSYQTLRLFTSWSWSNIPSSSASQCNSLNTSSGSIRLSNLHIESNGSEPNTPTTQHSDAHAPQPGDRDNFRRLIIEPLGYNSIPLNTQGRCSMNLRPRVVLRCSRLLTPRRVLTPRKKKDGLSHAAQETYSSLFKLRDRYILISQNIIVLYLLRVKTHHLHKKKTRIFGKKVSVNRLEVHLRLSVKGDRKKKSWYCGSSSSSFDGGDRETISAMESKIAYLNAELLLREEEREERRKREEERGGDQGNKGGREQEVCKGFSPTNFSFESEIFFLHVR
ncbi:hypothetical protein H5410_001703 [Solanum commersonii]|uniref:Uncharacterized protein n=1 Tax=Solanum commersonii TaxID=4109 RepID=A0A9J6B0B9_SOLCO|nr:hypothetical protein H5410_001703 [Solanum commersonii]